MDMLDSQDALIVLADNLPWSKLEDQLQKYYTGIGRPPKSIRLMVGLLLLKQMERIFPMNTPQESLYYGLFSKNNLNLPHYNFKS